MHLLLYWLFFAVLPVLFCYLAGYTTLAAVLGVYVIAKVLGNALGSANVGVRESWYLRRMGSPEYGGLKNRAARFLTAVVYEVACHFGLWVNDLPPAPVGVARNNPRG